MFDWLLTMLLGRDIVNPKLDEQAGISHALYEPGQIIVAQNESRHLHYLIEAGEVEVVTVDTADESVVATLRRGQYFGHTIPSAECCIRARTRVRLLAIDGAAADALSEVPISRCS